MYMFWPKPSLFHFLALIVTNPTSPYFINKQGSVKGEMLRSRGQQRGGVYLHALVSLQHHFRCSRLASLGPQFFWAVSGMMKTLLT